MYSYGNSTPTISDLLNSAIQFEKNFVYVPEDDALINQTAWRNAGLRGEFKHILPDTKIIAGKARDFSVMIPHEYIYDNHEPWAVLIYTPRSPLHPIAYNAIGFYHSVRTAEIVRDWLVRVQTREV